MWRVDKLANRVAFERVVSAIKKFGRGIILSMPYFLTTLGYIGTAAMLWVGAEIIAHGIPPLHHALEDVGTMLAGVPFFAWFAKVLLCAIGGLILGAIIEQGLKPVQKIIKTFKAKKVTA